MEMESNLLNLIPIELLEVARLKTAREYVTIVRIARALNMHRETKKRAHVYTTTEEKVIFEMTKIECVEMRIGGEAV